jgi:hypothetical protein
MKVMVIPQWVVVEWVIWVTNNYSEDLFLFMIDPRYFIAGIFLMHNFKLITMKKIIDQLKKLVALLLYFIRRRDDNFDNPYVSM